MSCHDFDAGVAVGRAVVGRDEAVAMDVLIFGGVFGGESVARLKNSSSARDV